MCLLIKMDDELIESKEEISRMFADGKVALSPDEELSLNIIHKFNIDRDTMETMPAFEKHLKQLFLEEKEK